MHSFSIDAGSFMYFDTSAGKAEDMALLESRILYPKRTQQCLQFFYKITGSPSDKLVIWVRKDDGTGNVRTLVKVETFQGNFENIRWQQKNGVRGQGYHIVFRNETNLFRNISIFPSLSGQHFAIQVGILVCECNIPTVCVAVCDCWVGKFGWSQTI